MTTAQSAEKSAAVREGAHEYFPDRHSSPRRMPNPMTTAQSAEKSAAVREGAHEDVTWKPEASSADPVVAESMRYRPFCAVGSADGGGAEAASGDQGGA